MLRFVIHIVKEWKFHMIMVLEISYDNGFGVNLSVVNLQVKSVFGAKMFALGVVIKIPVPKQTAKTSFQVTSGRAKYNAAIDCLVWK